MKKSLSGGHHEAEEVNATAFKTLIREAIALNAKRAK
jgi:hypothetical protein